LIAVWPSSLDKEQETVELTGKNYTRNDWRKMLSTRRGTVFVAGVCAAVAALILVVAMNGYRQSVNTAGNPATVLVAGGLIQKGTSGDAIAAGQLFKPTTVASKQVTSGAFADSAQLHGKVAAVNIEPGQQLAASDFTGNGGLATQLGANQRAVTITVDSAHGMVGQIHEGDHVDVYADLESAFGHSGSVVRLLTTNTPVLKAASGGSQSLGGGNPQNQQSNVTLKVRDDQAGPLAFASDNGKVWLVLRPANASPANPPFIVTAQSLLLGKSPTNTEGTK
jgi:Flp pilus assembly protein CpaB